MLEYLGDPSSQWIWGAAQALAIIVGFYFVVRQISLARHQNSITHMIYFRDLWLSLPLLRARQDLGRLRAEPDGTLDPPVEVVATFANDIGIAVRTGQVDVEHVWRYFSHYLMCYWVVLAPHIRKYREVNNFKDLFISFEQLCNLLAEIDKREGSFPITKLTAERFQLEDAAYADYFIDAHSGKFRKGLGRAGQPT